LFDPFQRLNLQSFRRRASAPFFTVGAEPTEVELTALRDLEARTAAAHGQHLENLDA